MIYIVTALMLMGGYYSFTYGVSLWKEKNRLGGFGTMAISFVGTISTVVMMYLKR